ncbi:MAG: PD-(D/E)XK nuclease family protein [Labilithrix sp.]|nr:PD-(D/E)XK nuclease family protein [Labilithrix sp.]
MRLDDVTAPARVWSLLGSVPRAWLVVATALAVLYALAVAVRRRVRRARMRRRFARGAEGEREAAHLLEAHGFTIEGAQVAGAYDVLVDGAPVAITVRADYIVARDGARFVAEVKTGRVAPRIETAATRRQLLEYQHAFGVARVLLVDADQRRVQLIELPGRASAVRWPAWALAGAVFAALAVAWTVR